MGPPPSDRGHPLRSLAPSGGIRRSPIAAALLLAGLVAATLSVPSPALAANAPTAEAGWIAAAKQEAKQEAKNEPAKTETLKGGRYIVTLRGNAAATYTGGLTGLPATAPKKGTSLKMTSSATQKYTAFLSKQQKSVAESVGARTLSTFSLATNGFTAKLTSAQATALQQDARVSKLVKDELLHPLAVSSADFLGLSGENGVWAKNGGVAVAGKGVVVGIIDTGIAPENASFAGSALGTTAGTEPYLDGTAIKYTKGDGGVFTGECVSGVQFDASDCSTKIVGARYFGSNFGYDSIGTPSADHEYKSPRDGSSHGSHTASTAAGNNGVAATIDGAAVGTISGVAPAAKIAAYKVCWTGKVAGTEDDNGCATGDILDAIDAAVADNVDVINFSIGGGTAASTNSLTDQAFYNAAAAGIFVAAAGGNAGPDPETLDNAAPWITTVAASTIPTRDATVELGDGTSVLGASITVPDNGLAGSLVAASASGKEGAETPELCGTGTLDESKVTGKIVLCERGVSARIDKSAEVKRAGGIGMILVNKTADSLDLDVHTIPVIHVDANGYDALTAYAATTNPTVKFVNGNTSGADEAAVPQVAGFSSRGPVLADGGDVLKPDLAAPGVGILAAAANAEGASGAYEFMSGTSMASPHVAGLAALYLGIHATATPAAIKSALMTTTYPTVTADGSDATDVFAQGAGEVDPTRYLDPGLVYLNDVDDWNEYLKATGYGYLDSADVDASDLNLASISIGGLAGKQTITREVTSTRAGSFTAADLEIPGVDAVVEPSTLSFDAAGESKKFTVTFTVTDAELDQFTSGYLTWASDDDATDTVRSAVAVRPISLDAPAAITGEGVDGSVDVSVLGGMTADVDLNLLGLAKGEVVNGSGVAGGTATYLIDVPENIEFGRFDLDSIDPRADLDLYLYQLDANGGRFLMGQSATSSSDERIDLDYLWAGKYALTVDLYSGAGDLDFALSSFLLGADTSEGDFTATPPTVSLVTGETSTTELSWTGLDTASVYLGRVGYGDTGVKSLITVTTDGTPADPAEAGDVKLTVAPKFVRPGQFLTVDASGLAGDTDYTISFDGAVLASGTSSLAGKVARGVAVPAGTTVGDHDVTVTTADGATTASVTVASFVIAGVTPFERPGLDGLPSVGVDTEYSGGGKLHTVIASVATGEQFLDTTDTVVANPNTNTWISSSERVKARSEKLVATVSTVGPDGKDQQTVTTTWTPESHDPSVIAFTPAGEKVQLSVQNNTGTTIVAGLRYKLTSGELIYAGVFLEDGAWTPAPFDLTGVSSISLESEGTTLASFTNTGANAKSGTPDVAADFWATYSDKGDTGVDGMPITAVVSNKPAAYTYGYDLGVGVGVDDWEENPFYFEPVDVEFSDKPGAVIERELAVPTGKALRTTAYYEIHSPVFTALAIRILKSPALSLADLKPVEATDPGLPAAKLAVTAPTTLVAAGSTMKVTASGLEPGETYTLRFIGKSPKVGRADAAGKVSVSMVVPSATTAGKHQVKVTGSAANRVGTASITTVKKTVKLAVTTWPTKKVHSGKTFTVTVRGLAAGEPVTVKFAGYRVSAAKAVANSKGVYTVKVNTKSLGKKTIAVTGLVKGRAGTARITVIR